MTEVLMDLAERKSDVAVGLVTGNLEEIAWMKMEGLDKRQYLSTPNLGGLILARSLFIFFLLLEILLDWQARADGAQLENVSELNVSLAPHLIKLSQLNISSAQVEDDPEWGLDKLQLINDSMLNITLPPGVDLGQQNKTVENYNVPLPVYIAVPVVTAALSAGLIYGFCWWRLKLVRRRKKITEKQNLRRRRSSLKPGSSERGKKFGLTRAIGPDGDPLIIPTSKVLSLARKLDDIEQLVLDYQSYDMGDRFPEKQEYKIKEEAYVISINPLFNTLQSGACGYVLGADDKAATSPAPDELKSDEGSGPDDDSDSDSSPKNGKSKKLSDAAKRASAQALERLSKLSPESKSKEDPLRRSLATKSLKREVQMSADDDKEGETENESSGDVNSTASTVESEASSDASLDTESVSSAISDDESDAVSVSQSPVVSRLAKETSESDSLTKANLSPTSDPRNKLTSTGSPKASISSRAIPGSLEDAYSTENSSGAESGPESSEESSTASPRASQSTGSPKSPAYGAELKVATWSSKSSKAGDSEEEKHRASTSSTSSKALDGESPRASSVPRGSRASSGSLHRSPSAYSGDDSPRSSSAPRASKSAVSGGDVPRASLSRSASKLSTSGKESGTSSESKIRKHIKGKGSVSPRFSDVTTSDRERTKDSVKKSDWNPKTVPERPSIKRSES